MTIHHPTLEVVINIYKTDDGKFKSCVRLESHRLDPKDDQFIIFTAERFQGSDAFFVRGYWYKYRVIDNLRQNYKERIQELKKTERG